MSETPIKGIKKYQTISVEKGFRTAFSTTAHRLTERRKSNSVLANPQSILATPLPQIQDLSLPKIQQKRKTKKQGTFLQSWLDEALGAPDPLLNEKPRQQQRVQSNILKTLKKYELDKRHLQSQNIPSQKVQKLYQSLYIYTHGVNHIFQQLIKMGKDFQYPDLVGNFWKAYTKLLESCTSYQTVFQKVEKDHLLNIRHLRANIEKRAQQFLLQRKQWETKAVKLQKSLQEKELKYSQLNADFEVIQNTLQLTDEAFNEQVNLRLKFEEKINAVYTCYQELKAKYAKLVEDMQIKNTDLLEGENKQNELKNLLSVEKTKVQQLIFLLKVEQDRVKQRQTEIIIKNQQLQDASALVQARSNEEDKTHDRMEEYLSKFKALQSKLIEVQNVVKGQKLTIKQQEEQIKKISKSLEYHKDQNNQIYIKYSNSGKKVVQLQSRIQQRNMEISELKKLSIQKGSEVKDLARELQHVKDERDNLRNQLTTATRSLKNTQDTMDKNSIILDELKAVKDKYERINGYLRIEIQQLQAAHNKSMEDLRVKTQELEGMKLLLDNRNKALNQAQKSIEQERQLNKIKVSALNAAITKKEALTIEYQKKSEDYEKNILNFKSQMKLLQEKNIILQSLKMKLQVELNRKIKLLADLEDVLNKQNIKFKQLNKVLESQLKQKSNINSKLTTTEFVLKTKNEEERVEVQSLSLLLSEYKARLIQTSQYIHPMVYQQALEIARRCEYNESKAKKQEDRLKKQEIILLQKIKGFETQLASAQTKITQMQKKLKRLSQQKGKQSEEKIKLQQKCKRIQNSLSQMTKNHEKQSKNGKKLAIQIEQMKKIQKENKQKIESIQSQLFNTKSMLQKLVGQRKKTSRAQTRQVKRQKEIKREIKQIKQQQTQTQLIQQGRNRIESKKKTEKQEIKIQKEDKQIQTDLLQQIIESSRQIFEPYNHETKKEETQNTLIRKQKQESGQRKIENKQFKRALKLTYMRR